MKIEEINQLTDMQKCITIARAVGIISASESKEFDFWYPARQAGFLASRIPNYLWNLDAMHRAYQYLVSISKPESAKRQPDVLFNLYLMEVCNPGVKLWDNGTYLGNVFHALATANATAYQRAIAFLLVYDSD